MRGENLFVWSPKKIEGRSISNFLRKIHCFCVFASKFFRFEFTLEEPKTHKFSVESYLVSGKKKIENIISVSDHELWVKNLKIKLSDAKEVRHNGSLVSLAFSFH